MKYHKLIQSLILIMSLIGSTLAYSAPAQKMSMRHAINTVEKQYSGKLLKAYETRRDQQTFYRIKMLTQSGRVVSFLVNAHSGKVTKE